MTIVIHPQLGRPGHARAWVGNWDRVGPPALAWRQNGAPVQPVAVRPVASARPPGMVADDAPRAFTGVYEFPVGDAAGIEIGVANAEGESASTWAWAPPATLDDGLNVLMVSCFHRDEENRAALRGVARQLRGLPVGQRPDLTLLMGDQVYLDLPTLRDFKDNRRWLAAKFERDYTRNWGPDSGFHDLLQLAPSVAVPDDHEFWNNFPHASPVIGNSHSESGRKHWREAATALYSAFQMREPDSQLGLPARFDIGQLSFCVMDTRTHRDEQRRFVQGPAARDAFADWCDTLIDSGQRIGVAVTGQLLTNQKAGGMQGRVADWELPNYGDHAAMRQRFGDVLAGGGTLLWLTGDVHWGRVMRAAGPQGHNQLFEVIASPATLLTTTGKDAVSRLGGWLGGLFGAADPWPRHSDTEEAPSSVTLAGRRYNRNFEHVQKGDHVAMLNFRGTAPLSMQVSYWPVRKGAARVDVPRFLLRA